MYMYSSTCTCILLSVARYLSCCLVQRRTHLTQPAASITGIYCSPTCLGYCSLLLAVSLWFMALFIYYLSGGPGCRYMYMTCTYCFVSCILLCRCLNTAAQHHHPHQFCRFGIVIVIIFFHHAFLFLICDQRWPQGNVNTRAREWRS